MRFVIYNLEVTSWIIDQAGGSEEAVRDGTLNTGMSWLVVSHYPRIPNDTLAC